jgi:glutathione synthase/RimK-type ligase-like ATP-grasp enzyme
MHEAGIRVPEFGVTPMLGTEGKVLGRTRRGFAGRGITVYDHPNLAAAGHELYTAYIPNRREYRLHVVGDRVIRVQRKYLERGDAESLIRNHANGYVFKAPAKDLNQSRKDTAVAAVRALGLDFGAVDLVVDNDGLEWVLEVNTAPSCSPKTLAAYTDALREYLNANA